MQKGICCAKPDDPNLILESHMVEGGGKRFPKVVPWPLHVYRGMRVHACKHVHKHTVTEYKKNGQPQMYCPHLSQGNGGREKQTAMPAGLFRAGRKGTRAGGMGMRGMENSRPT